MTQDAFVSPGWTRDVNMTYSLSPGWVSCSPGVRRCQMSRDEPGQARYTTIVRAETAICCGSPAHLTAEVCDGKEIASVPAQRPAQQRSPGNPGGGRRLGSQLPM